MPKPLHQKYVTGFMFNHEKEKLALIRKNKPAWQAGKLNGIGGKVEKGEHIVQAMVREFREETGLDTEAHIWSHFARLAGPDWSMDCFAAFGDITLLNSEEEEAIEIHWIADMTSLLEANMIANLPWLVHLGFDVLKGTGPKFTTALYYPHVR